MDPLDALILRERHKMVGELAPNTTDYMVTHFGLSRDIVEVSTDNLTKLGCVSAHIVSHLNFFLTAYGRELMRACSD
jgi:hypothetical protein